MGDRRYNTVVIGAGAGGLVSAYMSAALKAKVALIEKSRMGGECLNSGCVPSKALIRTARFVHDLRRHEELGVADLAFKLDFAQIMARVHEKIADVAPHDSEERYRGLGVECIQGEAVILDPHRVQVGGRILQTKNIILALGAKPFIPAIKGLEEFPYLSSENLWELRELPRRLIVLGGGAIGCEMAQAFARLGSQVTQVEKLPRLFAKDDPVLAESVVQRMKEDGVSILTSTKAVAVFKRDGENLMQCLRSDGREIELVFDSILVAVGRKANTDGVDWQKLGVELNADGTFRVDEFLRTTQKNIYACGDCVGPFQLTQAASHQAWYASTNALFSPFKRFKVDYTVLPWCTYTDPEIAQVGLNEEIAVQFNIPHEITFYDLADSDRAIVDSEAYGAIKVLTVPGKDRILGVTIVGSKAGELIAVYALAMKNGLGLRKILTTVHAYPTLMEANKAVAGAWTRPRIPKVALKCLEVFHRWRA